MSGFWNRHFSGLLAVGALVLVLGACASADTSPEARAVSLETTACGNASRTSGAGVIVEDGWVLASAHVVAGAGSVSVSRLTSIGEVEFSEVADIVVLDVDADLALLSVPPATASPIELGDAERGDTLEFAGGGPSGAFAAAVVRPVEVRIEAVRSAKRIRRFGYEIDVRVELGDSGGGGFDGEGHLVGVVFGRADQDEQRSFIVGHRQIADVLADDRSGHWACDPDQHRVEWINE